jgi:hypothetical protein
MDDAENAGESDHDWYDAEEMRSSSSSRVWELVVVVLALVGASRGEHKC